MKKMNLVRQNTETFEFATLGHMIEQLQGLQQVDVMDTEVVKQYVEELIEFQTEEGSFNLFDTYQIESDARVDFCHMPTYLATAFLIKVLMRNPQVLAGKEETVLAAALKMCCARTLTGHGYESMSGQVEALHIFLEANVCGFLKKYPNLCLEFTEMIYNIIENYRKLLEKGTCTFDWGQDYAEQFRKIVDVFDEDDEMVNVFVYGTLLKGQSNYKRYLAPSEPDMRGEISGYKMYDVGCFPCIVEGDGKVKGEVYKVTKEQLAQMDYLESEGQLYNRVRVSVIGYDCESVEAFVYVYNHTVAGLDEIPYKNQPYKNEYVWYVAYGSNMLRERFACYVKGGYCWQNGKTYNACMDDEMPTESRNVVIPYDMYYSNYNRGSWANSAVAFLDVSHPGFAYGRAYLVKKNQLEHIHRSEGIGQNWYPDLIELESIDGIRACTFTNKVTKNYEAAAMVSAPYFSTMFEGMKELACGLNDREIVEYLLKR